MGKLDYGDLAVKKYAPVVTSVDKGYVVVVCLMFEDETEMKLQHAVPD